MAGKSKAGGITTGKVKVTMLEKPVKELTKEEQKQVQGGTHRRWRGSFTGKPDRLGGRKIDYILRPTPSK